LIGDWILADEKNYRIVFTAGSQAEYYGKEVQAVFTYRCAKDTLISKDKTTGAIYKYALATLTDKNLTLIYLDRGNLLEFRRK
jgi:hypothetical protein